jgi:hypothetical protein
MSPAIGQWRRKFGVGAPTPYEEALEQAVERLSAEKEKLLEQLRRTQQKKL